MPFNNYLFYTHEITDFNLIKGLISEAKTELDFKSNKPTKVWVYSTKGDQFKI